jgi:hypothetical protein
MLSNYWILCCVSLPDGFEDVFHRSVVAGAGAGSSWLLLLLLVPAFWFSSVMARG